MIAIKRKTYQVNIRLNNQPIYKILDYLNATQGIRYKVVDGIVHIQDDIPYTKGYYVSFLNLKRTKFDSAQLSFDTNNLDSAPDSSSSGNSGSRGNAIMQPASNSSKSTIKAYSRYDVWHELRRNLDFILNDGKTTRSSNETKYIDEEAVVHKEILLEKTKNVRDTSKEKAQKQTYHYSINQSTGMLFVHASQKIQKKITNYLKIMKRIANMQVLVEAKVLSVELNDQYSRGINWNWFQNSLLHMTSGLTQAVAATSNITSAKTHESILGFDINGNPATAAVAATGGNPAVAAVPAKLGFTTFLKLLDYCGSVRQLSNPRIQVLNNQVGTFKVTTDKVFSVLTFDREHIRPGSSSDSSALQSNLIIKSKIKRLPLGFVIMVQPCINPVNGEITMHIKPAFSSEVASVKDTGAELSLKSLATSTDTFSGIEFPKIPVVRTNEIETIAKVQSGHIIALGGFMQIYGKNSTAKTPGLGDIEGG